MQGKKQNIHGFLNLYKEPGISSNQALGQIKRILHPKKIGHGGTLDVMAEGVLPVAFGEATKTLQFLLDSDKEYEFELTWGFETDTFDLEGEVTAKSDIIPTKEDIEKAMLKFIGEIEQIPPVYSALKFNGKNAYELARAGHDVDMTKKARNVNIYNFELLSHEDNKTFLRAAVSKGTYIRTLGIDLARSLNSRATVSKLIRTKTKKFDKKSAICIKKLDELAKNTHNSQDLLLNVDMVLDDIPVFIASNSQAADLKNGQIKFVLNDIGLYRIYNEDNILLSIVDNTVDGIKIMRNFNLTDIDK
ncbi:MAG: tRNA pseudouridine synthase B [Proteobacteria bacterium]|nr:MAG: tRNA pseudouridine synthase B [Pseudomonadota bacterium]